jgi:hypothetical protein
MQTIVMIVCVICVSASIYLVCLGILAGEGIPWLFAAFAALFGIPLVMGLFKFLANRSTLFRHLDEKLTGRQEPKTTFVPHWFMVTAITIAIVLILAAVIIPIIVRQ